MEFVGEGGAMLAVIFPIIESIEIIQLEIGVLVHCLLLCCSNFILISELTDEKIEILHNLSNFVKADSS